MTKVEQRDSNVIAVSGDLLFSSVMTVRGELESLLAAGQGDRVLDLAGVSRADSSALALWFACRRYAKSLGFDLSLRNIPQGMASVADLVGLDHSLG
ncbi:STAS domain-containing protein [Marinobacterium sp. YM272]|uniref:STAS domain-containing protein n=1 Tax=Marinobacterium sp. YM272 TaxID=3421654 RepID=UPI003D7F5241